MSADVWVGGFSTLDGRIVVTVIGDQYLDGGTVRYRNHRIRIRVTDEVAGDLELSPTKARELADLLNQAAAHSEQQGGR
ncbi:hypothetical protein MPUL_34540 [Mycolicibacterium pulveris]|uniref:Uncharacterized protein n=1 Tax=Mycolicibacterium pulveris TaxID=36813 RepID=A0A7I7UQ76_MYCPV|nr:hypothetical protein MPUL_34540 [Mycolicibacterium pulveris]